jgi:transglutaminase-like putative cysteine protease
MVGARSAPAANAARRGAHRLLLITLEPHWKPWLLALEMPASAPLAEVDTAARRAAPAVGVITDDQRVFTSTMITQTIRYRMTSAPGDAYPAGSGLEAQRADNLQLPTRESNPRTIEFARALRADHPDDADFVRAALRFFRTDPFFYTLAPALLPGPDPVDAFLFDSRRGFCEHYASNCRACARRQHPACGLGTRAASSIRPAAT